MGVIWQQILQIFDILPLYGTLLPGETEQVTLTFFGHANIVSQATAICDVEGGPKYEITLKGDASVVEYHFDSLDIDYGKIVSDNTCINIQSFVDEVLNAIV